MKLFKARKVLTPNSQPADVEDKTDTLLRIGSKAALAGDAVVACAGEGGLLSVAKSLAAAGLTKVQTNRLRRARSGA